MKEIVIVNGIHGSGKSTLGQLLAENNTSIEYFPEIGGQLRSEVTYNSLQSGEDFDNEVIRRELDRDRILLSSLKTPLVETWHLGNIGYVAVRSPQLLPYYRSKLEEQLTVFKPRAILFDIGWEAFKARIREKVAPDQINSLINLYSSILETTTRLYDEYQIQSTIINTERTIEECLKETLPFLSHENRETRTKKEWFKI